MRENPVLPKRNPLLNIVESVLLGILGSLVIAFLLITAPFIDHRKG